MIESPYFWAGFAAGAFFLLSIALVGLSWFAAPSGKKRLLAGEGVALVLMLALTTWLGLDLWGRIQAMTASPEPPASTITSWAREAITMLILGLALVFGSLFSCFGWVRAGFAGNGIRSVVWAVFGLRVVLSSVVLVDLFNRASNPSDPAFIAEGKLAEVATPVLEQLQASMVFWLPLVVSLFLLSGVVSVVMRKN